MAFGITTNTLQRAFTSVSIKKDFADGADYRSVQNEQWLQRIVNYLADIFTFCQYGTRTEAEIQAKHNALEKGQEDIYKAISAAIKKNETSCIFTISDEQGEETQIFSIIQFTNDESLHIAKTGDSSDSDNFKKLPFKTLEELRDAIDQMKSSKQ